MATLKNKRKLAALNKESCEEHPRNNLPKISNDTKSQDNQVSEEIAGRVTKQVSPEFIQTENRNLSALSRLDGFLLKPFIQDHFRASPETSRIA